MGSQLVISVRNTFADSRQEVPSNTLLVRFKKPSHYIGTITVAWGIVMTLTGLVTNYSGLIAARFMLGVCE